MIDSGCIYIITNKINNKNYIGQTVQFKKRINQHINSNSCIGKAIKKYGMENFEIKEFNNIRIEWLDWAEQEMIKSKNSIAPNGYNIMLGGQLNRMMTGVPLSEETKKKISESHKGKKLSKEHCKNLSLSKMGHSVSTEAKIKMSVSAKKEKPWLKGKKHSKEQIEKQRQSMLGKPSHNKGKKYSEEYKKRLSDSHKGKPNNQLGLKRSIESKLKMSLAKKGISNPKTSHPKKVMCIETGIIYNSIKEATIKTNINGISKCCKQGNGSKGTHWKLLKENL